MRGLTNQCGVMERRSECLAQPYRQRSADRTSQYCDMPRSTSAWVRGPHKGATELLILLADRLPPNGYSPSYAPGPTCTGWEANTGALNLGPSSLPAGASLLRMN